MLNCLVVWLFGQLGIAQALGVQLAPPLTTALLYPKLVWGGIWGLAFLVPLGRVSFPVRGLLFSLGPSLAQLFWVFPLKAHKGLLGLELGALTPLFVLFYNAGGVLRAAGCTWCVAMSFSQVHHPAGRGSSGQILPSPLKTFWGLGENILKSNQVNGAGCTDPDPIVKGFYPHAQLLP